MATAVIYVPAVYVLTIEVCFMMRCPRSIIILEFLEKLLHRGMKLTAGMFMTTCHI